MLGVLSNEQMKVFILPGHSVSSKYSGRRKCEYFIKRLWYITTGELPRFLDSMTFIFLMTLLGGWYCLLHDEFMKRVPFIAINPYNEIPNTLNLNYT